MHVINIDVGVHSRLSPHLSLSLISLSLISLSSLSLSSLSLISLSLSLSFSLSLSLSLLPFLSFSQARLQRANTLLRLGKINEATVDFQALSDSASGTVKEDALIQVSTYMYRRILPISPLFCMLALSKAGRDCDISA